MPIYEYRCQVCGESFEKMVKLDAAAPPCPACGGDVRKLVSAASFVLKGGGWYKDHYGLKSGKASAGEGAASGGSSEGAKPASEGAKPAAKPASGGDGA